MSYAVLLPLLALLVSNEPPPKVVGPIPAQHHAALEAGLPQGQRLVQTLEADLDGDGQEEWIAIGEPIRSRQGISIAIFQKPRGRQAPKLRFAQMLLQPGLRIAGAEIREVRPLGQVVVLVGADPSRGGDSLFRLEIYGWNGEYFRPFVPEEAEFRSQGGFSIEPAEPAHEGDEIVVWSYVADPDELLYDYHHYSYRRWRWDGIRFVVEDATHFTETKQPTPEAAGKAAGAQLPDRRRQIERVAEVP